METSVAMGSSPRKYMSSVGNGSGVDSSELSSELSSEMSSGMDLGGGLFIESTGGVGGGG